MKTAIAALLAVLVLMAALSGLTVRADDTTFVTNLSSRAIRASTTYLNGFGNSDFTNRLIAPQTDDSDQYLDFNGSVEIELWVEGAAVHNNVVVKPDQSIVAYDDSDASGVDIFLAEQGSLVDKASGVLITIGP